MRESKVKRGNAVAALIALFLVGVAALGYDHAGRADRILLVGDSTVRGESYSKLLGSELERLRPAKSPEVINGAEWNQNSSELLAKLPAMLEEYRPKVLVVMVGEANSWNHHGLNPYLAQPPGGFDFFRRWVIVRWLARLWPRPARRFFPEVPAEEYPTLALRWAGYLNAWPEFWDRLSARDRNEARACMERWLADSRSGPSVTVTRVLAELETKERDPAAAARTVQRYFDRGGGFNISLFAWLKRRGDAAGLARMRMLAPARENYDPSNPRDYGPAAAIMVRQGRKPEARRNFLAGLRENPFYAGGELPPFSAHSYFSEAEFRRLVAEALPPPASGTGEKPGLAWLPGAFLDREAALGWVYHDLAEIVRVARDHHATPLLQTYPPARFPGEDDPVNGVIRSVAIALHAPLSDTASELNQFWGKRDRTEFYVETSTPGDDRLSPAGNRLVAEFLSASLAPLLAL